MVFGAMAVGLVEHNLAIVDETCFVDGYPGRYIVLARRNGSRWYVCALNGQKQVQNINVSLPMLAGKQVTWLSDGTDGKSPSAQQVTLDKLGTLRADIPGECAVVLY